MLMKMSLTRLCILNAFLAIIIYKCYVAGVVCNHHCVHNGKCNSKHVHDTCYYLFKDTNQTWSDSKHYCESKNLSVGQIRKGFDTDGLFLGVSPNGFAWQGGTIKKLGHLECVNGIQFNGTTQHYHYNSKKCGTVNQQQGKDHPEVHFDVKDCTEKLKYICHLGQDHFTTSQRMQSWFDARSACLDQGGDLFYLNSDEIPSALLDQFKEKLPFNEAFYIGVKNFKWMWPDDSEIENYNWKLEEPGNENEECIVIDASDAWQDWPCNSTHYTICQKEFTCNNLPAPANGTVYIESGHLQGKTLHGHRAIFTCNEGFLINGSATLTCIEDGSVGRFDGQPPSCELIKGEEQASTGTTTFSSKVIPWILFGISLLIIGALFAYVVISK